MNTTPAYDPAGFRDVFEQRFTYWAGFARNTHRYARSTAMSDPATGRAWTYAELGEEVERLAAGLAAHGVGPGDLVAYQLFNGPEFALLWLATQRLGAVGSPVNFRLAPGETAHILDTGRPAVFVYDTSVAESAGQALERAGHAPKLVVHVPSGQDGDHPLPGSVPFVQLAERGAGQVLPPAPEAGIYAETTRLYTSGTTGLPKGVPLNNAVEVLSAHDVIMHFPLSPEDRTLNMSPWFHRGGLYSGGPNPVFYVGGEVVPLRHFDADVVLDLVEKRGITFLIGAPTNLERLADAQERRPRDLSTLRGIVTMGAPLDRVACLRYQEVLTPRIFNGYGTTEAFWNTFLRPADLPDHAGSAGRACTDDDVAVVKVYEDRRAEPDDLAAKDGSEIGEVIVRSPKSGYGYIGRPEEQAENFRQGWLYIGDLATWDEDEYVTIVGRRDDMILSGGENVHPVQVEAVLNEHPGVADAAVVGAPDPEWGQLVTAYVVRKDPEVTVADLEKHCRAHPMLAAYKRPRAYRFVDALPVTSTGKKIHYQLRERVAADAEAGLLERVGR
ncbi:MULTISPECIES: class I adenylate-forming enzyme family protein [Streptomyces]|uniref:AMP-binding protein n=1 Tax=Streptomyces evansiae TaxID=3075535 RepID=A0ABU2QUC0_9ACTN|nr:MULTISPECIES: AMP-binding protein [unclassified Streptomyces]MDT0408041.1 AMP-binding protein [Streptomyces sp. DSM 41979]MYQ59395.1 AMP-binding protein [Streptomyces sp. SID4926]